MPQYRLDDALDQISTYVIDTGDAVKQSHVGGLVNFVTDFDESYALRGHRCTADEAVYLVAGHPELRFVVLAYPYYLRAGLADGLNDEVIKELTDEKDDTRETDRAVAAIKQLFADAEPELSALRYQLKRLSTGSDATVEFINEEPSETQGILIVQQLFPYEQRFSIEQFAACRSRVVSLGETVQAAIERAVSFQREETGTARLVVDTGRI